MNYNEATNFLLALPDMERNSHGSLARTMSLECMRALLHRLGDPQLGRKTAHVTGSKGKGSSSAMLSAMLAADYSCSLYTSPHLHSYLERICMNCKPVSESEFADGVSQIKDTVLLQHESDLGPVSTFGAMTSLYFYLNDRHQMQWQVVEVGMGGLFDATNVFDKKELVLISAVSLEHTSVLGKTTQEIARNKAGIIRPGCTVVLAPQHDASVSPLIEKICKEQNADFIDVAKKYKINALDFDAQKQSFILQERSGATADRQFQIRMLGLHQLDNAATAIAAIDALNEKGLIKSDNSSISSALEAVSVPGRMETLRYAGMTILIDGAHNGESMQALVDGMERHFKRTNSVIVLGVNSDKNIDQILEAIKPACSLLIASRSQSQKAMEPSIIFERAKQLGMNVQVSESSEDAFAMAQEASREEGFFCATGSLYLIAEIRELILGTNPSWSFVSALPKQT